MEHYTVIYEVQFSAVSQKSAIILTDTHHRLIYIDTYTVVDDYYNMESGDGEWMRANRNLKEGGDFWAQSKASSALEQTV